MTAYYNENDPRAAQWLRELIKVGLIAPGTVDERSIEDVAPADVMEFSQCHWFAGIGVWSYALRQAGWSDDRQVWTGSCPCQPFSSAGKGSGFTDERHLWPSWLWLIQQCRPERIFGEQVAQKAGESWLDLVSTDLEAEGYTVGAATTAACGFGAPHIRSRLYWVADVESERLREARPGVSRPEERIAGEGLADRMEHAASEGLEGEDQILERHGVDGRGLDVGLADTGSAGLRRNAGSIRRKEKEGSSERNFDGHFANEPQSGGPALRLGFDEKRDPRSGASTATTRDYSRAGAINGFWRDADWLHCKDGKWRCAQPSSFPLVDRSPSTVVLSGDLGLEDVAATQEARTMRIKGYGNAIVSAQAVAFIESYMEVVE